MSQEKQQDLESSDNLEHKNLADTAEAYFETALYVNASVLQSAILSVHGLFVITQMLSNIASNEPLNPNAFNALLVHTGFVGILQALSMRSEAFKKDNRFSAWNSLLNSRNITQTPINQLPIPFETFSKRAKAGFYLDSFVSICIDLSKGNKDSAIERIEYLKSLKIETEIPTDAEIFRLVETELKEADIDLSPLESDLEDEG